MDSKPVAWLQSIFQALGPPNGMSSSSGRGGGLLDSDDDDYDASAMLPTTYDVEAAAAVASPSEHRTRRRNPVIMPLRSVGPDVCRVPWGPNGEPILVSRGNTPLLAFSDLYEYMTGLNKHLIGEYKLHPFSPSSDEDSDDESSNSSSAQAGSDASDADQPDEPTDVLDTEPTLVLTEPLGLNARSVRRRQTSAAAASSSSSATTHSASPWADEQDDDRSGPPRASARAGPDTGFFVIKKPDIVKFYLPWITLKTTDFTLMQQLRAVLEAPPTVDPPVPPINGMHAQPLSPAEEKLDNVQQLWENWKTNFGEILAYHNTMLLLAGHFKKVLARISEWNVDHETTVERMPFSDTDLRELQILLERMEAFQMRYIDFTKQHMQPMHQQ